MLGMLALCEGARAEPPTPQPAVTPWLDASPDDQQAARALLVEGHRLFEQWLFVEAEGRYRAALARWRHPIIYLYLSQVRARRGDLVAAYENLQEALRHEPAPFSAEERQLAGALREALEHRLAWIEVACDQAGAEVWLDGERWLQNPGQLPRVVLPGEHLILARKEGFVPVTRVIVLKPGTQAHVELRMSPVESDGAPAANRSAEELAADQAPLQGKHLRAFLATAPGAASPAAIRPPATGSSQPYGERRQVRRARESRVPRIVVVAGAMQDGAVSFNQPFSYEAGQESEWEPISLPAPPVTPEEPWLPAGLGSSPGFDPWERWTPRWLYPLPPPESPPTLPGQPSRAAPAR